MGLAYGLHRLDDAAFTAALSFVAQENAFAIDDVRALLATLGREEPERFDGAESWDDVESLLDGDVASARGRIVLAAAVTTTWWLDKALDRPGGGFLELFAREKSLKPVASILQSSSWSGEPLVHIASVEHVVAARDAMVPWLDDGARERIASMRRLFGPRDYADAWRGTLWERWRTFGEAVTACADARAMLAVTAG